MCSREKERERERERENIKRLLIKLEITKRLTDASVKMLNYYIIYI